MDDHERRSRLEALFVAHGRAVLVYARRRADHATAADVLSDVFLTAWLRLEEIPDDALPWLVGCARRALLNQRRALRRRARLVERLVTSAPEASHGVEIEHDGALAEALAALSERDREVLLLLAWEGLSAEQAAQVLGCSQRALWVRAHRARRRLAVGLDQADRPTTPLRMEACND